jgi:hypothetical protein
VSSGLSSREGEFLQAWAIRQQIFADLKYDLAEIEADQKEALRRKALSSMK